MVEVGCYVKERIVFKDAYEKELDSRTTLMICKKLCRHFKINHLGVRWTSGRNKPKGSRDYILLNYDWNNFGVLCHELAHTIQIRKYSSARHNKKHWRIFERVIRYCRKKDWFQDELERRTSSKPIKPELTKKEIRVKKIESLELSVKKAIKKQETRIKRTQNLIKKNNRRISALKRHI